MMRLIFLLIASVLFMACAPAPYQAPTTEPGGLLVLELGIDKVRAHQLRQVSLAVREEMRGQPMIPLDPVEGRKVEADRLLVRPLNSADAPKAAIRIGKLADVVVTDLGGAIEIKFSDATLQAEREVMLDKTIEGLKRRADASGFPNALIQKVKDGRIDVRVPGLKDPQQLAALGAALTKAGVLTFNLVDVDADPFQYELGVERNGRVALPELTPGRMPVVVFTDSIITGVELASARSTNTANRPAISFQLKEPGRQRFARATAQNVGKPFAIVLDNSVVSAPYIRSPITGGGGVIEGAFTTDEAEAIAIILRAGALPLALTLVESRFYEADG